MGKRSTVVVLTILGLASTATVVSLRRPTETPFVCPEVVDLWSVDRGEFLTFVIPLGNAGGEPLSVTVASKSCSCILMQDIGPDGSPVVIPPDGRVDLSVKLRAKENSTAAIRETITFRTQTGLTQAVSLSADLTGRLTARPAAVSAAVRPGESTSVRVDVIQNGRSGSVRLGAASSSDPDRVTVRSFDRKDEPVDSSRPEMGTVVGTLWLDLPPRPEGDDWAEVTVPLAGEAGSLVIPVSRKQRGDFSAYPQSLSLPVVVGGAECYRGRVLVRRQDGLPFRVEVLSVPKGFSVEGGTGEASTQFFVVSGDGHASGGELLLAASAEGGARETVRVAIRSHRQGQ